MLELESLSVGQYGFIGNVFSFGFAVMASVTLFLWLMKSSVAPAYRMAITISGLVTAIAAYHYLQIMLSWHGAASVTTGDVLASGEVGTRALFWILSMIPFLYIVRELVIGLKESISQQPDEVKGLISTASILVVASWAFYPIVYLLPLLGVTGGSAIVAVETGYTIADIVAKAVFGLLIFTIAVRKGKADEREHVKVPAETAAQAEQKTPVKKGALMQS